MKKILLMFFAGATWLSTYGQNAELLNKRGTAILPQIGDWGFGMSATPFIDLAGNLFKLNSGSNFNNPAAFKLLNGTEFMAKYMDDTAKMIRISLSTQLNSHSQSTFIQQDRQTDPLATVEDAYSYSNQALGIKIGREYRRGRTRLQGFYGFDAGVFMSGGSSHYRYGNAMTDSVPYPTSTNWNDNLSSKGRITETRNGFSFGMNASAFAGAEYFIFPGFSIGAEAAYTIGFVNKGQGKATYEHWNTISSTATITEVNTGKSSSFFSNVSGGSLYLMLYF